MSEKQQVDPLQNLVLDGREVAREELAEALHPYVRFTRGGGIILERTFDELSARARVCCVLLAYKALQMLELRDDESVRSSDIEAETGMPGGTIRPKLAELRKERIAYQDGTKSWSIPDYALRRAVEIIGGES